MQIPPCPTDYLLWQQTMYNVLGTKWLRLHRGPGWNVVQTGQQTTLAERGIRDPLEPCISMYVQSIFPQST